MRVLDRVVVMVNAPWSTWSTHLVNVPRAEDETHPDALPPLHSIRRGVTQCLQLSNVAHLATHTNPIVAMRWLGPAPRLVSASCEKVANGYRNTVLLTDVRNRSTVPMRQRGVEAVPLTEVKASPLGRHVLLLFQGAPSEVWAMLPTARCVHCIAALLLHGLVY